MISILLIINNLILFSFPLFKLITKKIREALTCRQYKKGDKYALKYSLCITKLTLMKKFSFFGRPVLFTLVVALLFWACQKEQNTVATDTPAGSESAVIHGVSGKGPFEGSIDGSYAAALAKNFADQYKDANQTLQVAFSAKDLSAFIVSLQAKYKSDIIYVNFGLYGKGAPAPNDNDNGRMTVFFTGNNLPNSSSGIKSNGTDPSSDDYLNHGQIFP